MPKIASLFSLVLVVALSGCASILSTPPPEHFYEGPERPVTELALLAYTVHAIGVSVPVSRIDGKKITRGPGQYLEPGEHVVTFQWNLSLVRKRTIDVPVSFEAGKTYRYLSALLDFAPEDSWSCDVHVFAWIVDESNYVVGGYRPRQLAELLPTETPHGACGGYVEHLLDENRDEEQKGVEFNPGLFGG